MSFALVSQLGSAVICVSINLRMLYLNCGSVITFVLNGINCGPYLTNLVVDGVIHSIFFIKTIHNCVISVSDVKSDSVSTSQIFTSYAFLIFPLANVNPLQMCFTADIPLYIQ